MGSGESLKWSCNCTHLDKMSFSQPSLNESLLSFPTQFWQLGQRLTQESDLPRKWAGCCIFPTWKTQKIFFHTNKNQILWNSIQILDKLKELNLISNWKGTIRIIDEEVCLLLGSKERSKVIFIGSLCFPVFSMFSSWPYELYDTLISEDQGQSTCFKHSNCSSRWYVCYLGCVQMFVPVACACMWLCKVLILHTFSAFIYP